MDHISRPKVAIFGVMVNGVPILHLSYWQAWFKNGGIRNAKNQNKTKPKPKQKPKKLNKTKRSSKHHEVYIQEDTVIFIVGHYSPVLAFNSNT